MEKNKNKNNVIDNLNEFGLFDEVDDIDSTIESAIANAEEFRKNLTAELDNCEKCENLKKEISGLINVAGLAKSTLKDQKEKLEKKEKLTKNEKIKLNAITSILETFDIFVNNSNNLKEDDIDSLSKFKDFFKRLVEDMENLSKTGLNESIPNRTNNKDNEDNVEVKENVENKDDIEIEENNENIETEDIEDNEENIEAETNEEKDELISEICEMVKKANSLRDSLNEKYDELQDKDKLSLKEKVKLVLINKYLNDLDEKYNYINSEIFETLNALELEGFKNKLAKLIAKMEKLNNNEEITENNNKSKLIIGGVALTLVGAIAITGIVHAFKKDNKNDSKNVKDDENLTENIEYNSSIDNIEIADSLEEDWVTPTPSKEIEEELSSNVKSLKELGYDEYYAKLMDENFNEDVIQSLLSMPYIATVENYATVKEFNLNYLEDYENARSVFNITNEEAVDYVNRAYLIQSTNFYDDAAINQIVEIVMALDKKELFTQDNASLAQSFNTSFNRIVDNYLFGATTEEDINKLNALQYFAKDGSDMDKFLTRLGTMTQAILTEPDNDNHKLDVYNYINIFATSLNGYTNEPSALTDDEEFNNDAILNDYFDWYIGYNSFVAPLYPVFVSEEYLYSWENLQYLMTTALEGPEFKNICGEALTLGGDYQCM